MLMKFSMTGTVDGRRKRAHIRSIIVTRMFKGFMKEVILVENDNAPKNFEVFDIKLLILFVKFLYLNYVE